MEHFASGWKQHYYGKGDVIVYRLNKAARSASTQQPVFGANVLMLSGDVHVGTIASIVSTDKRFLLAGEDRAVIHQGVSSAIAYESVTGVSANAIRWLVLREHPLRGTFTGTVSEVVCERNFSVVSVQGNRAFRFTLFNEASEVPEQYYFGLEG